MSPSDTDLASINLQSDSFLGGSRPFHYRKGTSDEKILQAIFKQNEYDFRRLRRGHELHALYARMAGSDRKPLIVDAGANIGASAVWFASGFPKAHIVAIEPEIENYKLLQRNADGLNIQPVQAAIGAKEGMVAVVDPGEGAWGYRTNEDTQNRSASNLVRKITIDQIYRESADSHTPFMVKVDIEGAESELFSSETSWVENTPLIIVELHDWLLTRTANSRNFLRCVSQLDRDFVYVGENVYSIDNRLNS